MIPLRAADRGVILPVYAQPSARKNALMGEHAGRLKVAVTAAPEKGKANEAILEVVAEALGLKRSQVSLHRGETSRQKELLIAGMNADDLRRRSGFPA